MKQRRWLFWIVFLLLALTWSGCSPAATPQSGGESLPQPTQAPANDAGEAEPTLEPYIETKQIDLEWPPQMRLGESDTIRMRLVPDGSGYRLESEFPEHDITGQQVNIVYPNGYTLSAAASLTGVGFDISPEGEQEYALNPNEAITWRWTIAPRAAGQQRLSLTLLLRWEPAAGTDGRPGEQMAYSQAVDVRVESFLGMTRDQSLMFGFFSMALGGGLGLGLAFRRSPLRPKIKEILPAAVRIENLPGLTLENEDGRLLQSLFGRYDRLVVLKEFLSGYSGSRTFLVQPLHSGGRADAATIVKIGQREAIQTEAENFTTFVKDTLPPVTARLQRQPVSLPGYERAALQYTYIADPGQPPKSLREYWLEDPNPEMVDKLFFTFGPGWWLQRSPYVFYLSQEYDRFLPPHLIVRPVPESSAASRAADLDENSPLPGAALNVGELVWIGAFGQVERRADGASFTLTGKALKGQPPLRVRWLSAQPPRRQLAQVVATRASLLTELTADLSLAGLADPCLHLPQWLNQKVQGTRSIIHGDLNLENILVGPGGFLWLIDFANTREGHTLLDFAHLEVEVITRVLAPSMRAGTEVLAVLDSAQSPLLEKIESVARTCWFNPQWEQEWTLARVLAGMGALKYRNLDRTARQAAYLAAAWWARGLL